MIININIQWAISVDRGTPAVTIARPDGWSNEATEGFAAIEASSSPVMMMIIIIEY
jgi:hypothetical protein